MISTEYLRSRLIYEPETGKLYWKSVAPDTLQARQWNGRFAGKEAGSINGLGYRLIDIMHVKYPAHQIAWAISYGSWPVHEIDHINLNRTDNRIENLREATRSQNMQNRYGWSGFKGVSHKGGKWRARIQANKQTHYVGVFETKQEAHVAYCHAAEQLHGRFSRTVNRKKPL